MRMTLDKDIYKIATAIPKVTKKSSTGIICELTRLKLQQKYLECNQVKLDAHDLEDVLPSSGAGGDLSPAHSTVNNSVRMLINEIELLRTQLYEEFRITHGEVFRDIEDMWRFINFFKADLQPERFKHLSLNALRDRVVRLHAYIDKLRTRNENEMESLKKNFEKIEQELEAIFKWDNDRNDQQYL